ncbi:SEC-C motif-containing protein [Mucilaginibacter pineti]|uniref:SEC-C motif-containing protein n=1 Tax=Mucilaginibacter pineti TaxID=1391627 RepID=A0A1G7L2N9_9SPHI|nr:SEC-C metal-binding domain-containing protein [Mucilaginibacter pineti]SDF43802.1 SEC-C motif-containing protein [Mucilaginibacter pineti]
MVLKANSVFERDFITAKERFPKLKYGWDAKIKMWVITGELDICDTAGVYWNTFQIAMLVPRGYPYCVPIVAERSDIVPRDIDWHISPEGICCLDTDNSLIAMSKSGINVGDFIAEKVYTFFANQIHKLESKQYAGAEYAHHTAGVIQYYVEELNIPSAEAAIQILKKVLNKQGLSRNDRCPCGSGLKVKSCHETGIETIKSFGPVKIKKDIENIEKHLSAEPL